MNQLIEADAWIRIDEYFDVDA
jgi:hypothetical protein